MHAGDIFEAVLSGRAARRPNQYASATQGGTTLETRLIGQIVTDEHGTSASEWSNLHQGRDPASLVLPPHTKLDHHLAFLNFQSIRGTEARSQFIGKALDRRGAAIVDRDPKRLHFDQNVRIVGKGLLEQVLRRREGWRAVRRSNGASRHADLGPMTADKRNLAGCRANQRLELRDRTAADQCDTAIEPDG